MEMLFTENLLLFLEAVYANICLKFQSKAVWHCITQNRRTNIAQRACVKCFVFFVALKAPSGGGFMNDAKRGKLWFSWLTISSPSIHRHIPKAKATTIAETPELKRIAENTKIQSNVKYHADFEKAKGKLTQVGWKLKILRNLLKQRIFWRLPTIQKL